MSRFFVTGATGFLGTHLITTLRAHGHEVVAMCRKGRQPEHEGVVIRHGDILDAASVRDAAAGCTGVFHCAGKVSRKKEDAEELYRLHVEGTKNVLSACKDAGIRRAVIASTSGTVAVSDDPDKIATEADEAPIALLSRWPYYRSKLYAEEAALAMNEPGFEVVSVNPTLLLGPGDRHASSTDDVRLFLEGKIAAVPAGGASFVDARDAAEAMRLAMDKGTPGARYLVGACNLTLKELFGRLSRVSGVRAPWVTIPRSSELARVGAEAAEKIAARFGLSLPFDAVSLDMAQRYWYLDATLAETTLGWTSRDPMVTLADTVDDLRARGVVWPDDDGAPPGIAARWRAGA